MTYEFEPASSLVVQAVRIPDPELMEKEDMEEQMQPLVEFFRFDSNLMPVILMNLLGERQIALLDSDDKENPVVGLEHGYWAIRFKNNMKYFMPDDVFQVLFQPKVEVA